MTIAITLKVNDGVVLAADSATTFTTPGGSAGLNVVNVYNNANKVFNLHKGLPVGAITWGLGNIGPASISTLSKELRRRLQGEDPARLDWQLDPFSYQMVDVAERVRLFVQDEHYWPLLGSQADPPLLGLVVAGYSAESPFAEEYEITMQGAPAASPRLLRPAPEAGANWYGQGEALTRLILGASAGLRDALLILGVTPADVDAAVGAIRQQISLPLLVEAMPFQDAIDLAEWMVDLTKQFVRFTPGAGTVGGPVEVAGITRHEGFKWIKRKHYYGRELNPSWGT